MAEKIRYFVATLLLIAAIFGSWLVVNSIINNIDSQVIGSRLLIYVLPQFIGAAALYEKYFRKTGYVLGIYTSLFWGGFTLLSLYGRGQLLLQSSTLLFSSVILFVVSVWGLVEALKNKDSINL